MYVHRCFRQLWSDLEFSFISKGTLCGGLTVPKLGFDAGTQWTSWKYSNFDTSITFVIDNSVKCCETILTKFINKIVLKLTINKA